MVDRVAITACTASSIPAVIDYLVAQFGQSTALAGAMVSDGYPVARNLDMLTIGGTTEATISGDDKPASLGALAADEVYTVHLIALSQRGGNSNAVQKQVRDTAFTMYQAVAAIWQVNPRLCGPPVVQSWIQAIELKQTDKDDADSGRTAELHFALHVQARITTY